MDNPKSRLNIEMNALWRSAKSIKEILEYVTAEAEGGFKSTVSLKSKITDTWLKFEGATCASKKLAEKSAAHKALVECEELAIGLQLEQERPAAPTPTPANISASSVPVRGQACFGLLLSVSHSDCVISCNNRWVHHCCLAWGFGWNVGFPGDAWANIVRMLDSLLTVNVFASVALATFLP